MCYVFGVTSYSEMLRKYPRETIAELGWKGNLLLDSKSYVYKLACKDRISPKDFDLSSEERALLRRALKREVELQAKLKKLSRTYAALSPKEMTKLLSQILESPEYNTYVRKFIAKKLSFLISSYNWTAEDLVSEMKVFSYYAVMRKYPEYNDLLHIQNICKTAAHNRGINIIHESTAATRNRLITETSITGEKTYSAVHLPLDALSGDGGLWISQYEDLLVLPKENELDVSRALEDIEERQPPRKRLFLRLMRGKPDAAFTTFLGESNEDFAYRVSGDKLLTTVCSFIGVNCAEAQVFLEGLSELLEG